MFCTGCGKELGNGDEFCAYCGTPAGVVTPAKADDSPATKTKEQSLDFVGQEYVAFDWNLDGFPSEQPKRTETVNFNWDTSGSGSDDEKENIISLDELESVLSPEGLESALMQDMFGAEDSLYSGTREFTDELKNKKNE